MPNIELLNCDCMKYMVGLPDNAFDLAIVDPPYGLGIDGQKKSINKNSNYNRKEHQKKNWDNKIPDKQYFHSLKRVSRNQIIFGGNYFTRFLPPTKAWIFWYKGQNNLTMSDGELIWTSLKTVTRQIEINRGWVVMEGDTIHPTQKTVKLYKWILQNYANPGDRILDTHGGSMSSAIACYDLGYDLTLCELDKDFYKAGKERFETHKAKYTPASEIPITKNGEYKLF